MKIRKFTGMLVASMLVASSLVGCGGSDANNASSSDATSASTEGKKGPNGETLAEEQVVNGRYMEVITYDTTQVSDSESGSFFLATSKSAFAIS